ncbi:MAG: ABC transporter substrate-binding protein, partial [Rhodospirillaceae bacterium]|nr:ABC transporter substrate-binding protein [Rhodospirillaceae bacterium]
MARPRLRLRVAAVGLVVLAAVGAVIHFWPAGEPDPVVIAFAGALTGGDSAAVGRAELDAVRLLVAEYNRDGGVNGHPVTIDVHDDQDSSEKAQDAAYAIGQRSPAIAVI